MDPAQFKQAMRHCAGAVALVAVGTTVGLRTGLTVTAVCSLSDDPPSLLVCVNRNASAHPRIAAERTFSVNYLSDLDLDLALTFSGQKGIDGDNRFACGPWDYGVTGTPVFADAVVSFECELAREIGTRTHSIFIGEVVNVRSNPEMRPLVYLRSGFHFPEPLREAVSLVSLSDLESRRMIWSGFS